MRIIFCDEIPQHIIASDIAAYHPHSRTIYVRRRLGFWRTVWVLGHELKHCLIHTLHLPESWHRERPM
jgi:hypothetical protein